MIILVIQALAAVAIAIVIKKEQKKVTKQWYDNHPEM